MIRHYYERTTRLFLAFGRERATRTIHRAVWADGVTTLDQAFAYINQQVLYEAQRLLPSAGAPLHVADLGCGVGGSLFFLADHMGIRLHAVGITISRLQAQLAQQTADQRHVRTRCHFVEADYLATPLAQCYDLAIAIESFLHAPAPQRFFAQVATLLRPGGRLLICDDFRRNEAPAPRWLAPFQRGWLAPMLLSSDEAIALAAHHGLRLVSRRDLTPMLRLTTLPDQLAHPLIALGLAANRFHPLWGSLAGGLALQHALRAGELGYQVLCFERS